MIFKDFIRLRLAGKSVFDKIWESHIIYEKEDGEALIYVDRHLTHEVTSPMAFEGLREKNRKVRRPDLTFAVMDHNVPTSDRLKPIIDETSAKQIAALEKNSKEFSITLFDLYSPYQGIVHVIGPELGLTIPGITLVCGDSHTSTHGALGALAFGIGTSEVEHVFATQTLWLKKPKKMLIKLEGKLDEVVTAKDAVLWIIRNIGVGGGIGYILEYDGRVVREMDVEARMTLCNMAIEAGARTAIISPDEKVFNYVKGRPYAPAEEEWDEALRSWKELVSDPDAQYHKTITFSLDKLEPQVSWGTNPSMTVGISEEVPDPDDYDDPKEREVVERALRYMGLKPRMKMTDVKIDVVFIGSCTNGRLSDIIDAARVLKGRKISHNVRALIVPGSQLVKRMAERMGLHRIFIDAGFEWKNSGCSMCIAMNEDKLRPGERCASTSNRNFENRQGPGGRTHLVSPIMAAAAAVYGRFVDIRELDLPTREEVVEYARTH
ncbi:MAG: 3-isopropylmalate dehydratase large subunit [Aigarchaeota archaeon]|nr:3-isopropylmalate dehydratase large subunit [Aigarchaeota archaeon]MCX8192233.1 3-isopropylmalate dehydratase large subunit [Nitrososphaeria archaeon]MDW7986159.1 3-isopropylmalate dehydratase large subunit [Nitrososphaerota archaeon]